MGVSDYFSKQESSRKPILIAIHEIIIKADKKAVAEVGTMMGKEMIIYKTGGIFKYGLSSVKNHMSLHLMPIYGSSPIHHKYEKLLNKAKFQKGCINFKKDDDMPLDIVRQLLEDCAEVDLEVIMEKIHKNPESKYF